MDAQCDGNPGNSCVPDLFVRGPVPRVLAAGGGGGKGRGLGEPGLIQWSEETSSLAVAHRLN